MKKHILFVFCLLAVCFAGNLGIAYGGIESIIPESLFNSLLPYRNDPRCHAVGFYTYEAFINAANAYPAFGSTGNSTTKMQEIAAFLGQTSHETTGGWADAPGGPYAWGYCYVNDTNPADYCQSNIPGCPCASGKQYYGRGPIQLSWNYNYCPAGNAIGFDGINDPDIVARNATISFETALWFWMTAQPPKPSCHDVMTWNWTPTAADIAAGRLPGYGTVTNIINGGLECGHGEDSRVKDRIGFYKTYCDTFNVPYGPNLDCYQQRPFGTGFSLASPKYVEALDHLMALEA